MKKNKKITNLISEKRQASDKKKFAKKKSANHANSKSGMKLFLLKFSFIRFIRSFFHNQFSFYIKYFFCFVLLIIFLGFLYFIFYKKISVKELQDNILKHSSDLINSSYKTYNHINISGNNYTKSEDISRIVNDEIKNNSANLEYISIIDSLKKKIAKLPWIEEVRIARNLPSTLNITVKEYQPFAIWQNNGNKYIINKDGKIIEIADIEQFQYLLILNGEGANINAKSLFNILVINPEISKDIYSASWMGGRRWDVRFSNGLLVKLPESNIKNAWNKLIKIYFTPGALINLGAIDLRIEKKVYFEYNDQVIKDLKSL